MKEVGKDIKPVDTSHLIRSGDFCEVVSGMFKDDGLKRGNYVYVAGHKTLPISQEDMYTQRVMFLCHKANKEGSISMEEGFFLIDPSSLMKVDGKKQRRMSETLSQQIEESKLAMSESPSEHSN